MNKAVNAIINCKSKVILCGVGKSGINSIKNFCNFIICWHTIIFNYQQMIVLMEIWDSISKKDILILISYSGNTEELKNIIQYANRNKIKLIGIVSKKNSILYKN